MSNNKLLVYNPVAPTDEFLRQLDALNHDGVAHVLLGATAYEVPSHTDSDPRRHWAAWATMRAPPLGASAAFFFMLRGFPQRPSPRPGQKRDSLAVAADWS